MVRGKTLTLALLGIAASATAAAAQGFIFSYGIGDPYSDPYYRPYYRAYPGPPVYYDPPPVVVERPAPGLRSRVVVSPEEVQADLQSQGFSRLGPIDAQDGSYELTAADPSGNFVSLVVSMSTGQIVDLRVLEPSRRVPPAVVRPLPQILAPTIAAVPRTRPAIRQPVEPEPGATPPPSAPPPAASPPAAGSKSSKDPLVVY